MTMNDADIRFETEAERDERYDDLLQEIADMLGDKGYELDSHEETAAMLTEISAAHLPAQPVQQPNRDVVAKDLALVRGVHGTSYADSTPGYYEAMQRVLEFADAALAVPATGEVEWGTEIREPDGTLRDRDVWPTEKDARDAAEMYAETLISRTVSPWVVTP